VVSVFFIYVLCYANKLLLLRPSLSLGLMTSWPSAIYQRHKQSTTTMMICC